MTRIIIRAVPTRIDFVDYLRERIPDAEIYVDENFEDETMTRRAKSMLSFLEAMRLAGDDPCVHMEEDVLLTVGFRDKLEQVISDYPHNVIQFFSRRGRDLTVGSRWDNTFSFNVCYYLPACYSTLICLFWPLWLNNEDQSGGCDTVVNVWLRKRKEKHWIHVPSLVQHRVAESQIDHRRSSKRQSKTFCEPWV